MTIAGCIVQKKYAPHVKPSGYKLIERMRNGIVGGI
jgi:hypothetical protein